MAGPVKGTRVLDAWGWGEHGFEDGKASLGAKLFPHVAVTWGVRGQEGTLCTLRGGSSYPRPRGENLVVVLWSSTWVAA